MSFSHSHSRISETSPSFVKFRHVYITSTFLSSFFNPIAPLCMVVNARSLVKPGAASALYAELRSNKIDICFSAAKIRNGLTKNYGIYNHQTSSRKTKYTLKKYRTYSMCSSSSEVWRPLKLNVLTKKI